MSRIPASDHPEREAPSHADSAVAMLLRQYAPPSLVIDGELDVLGPIPENTPIDRKFAGEGAPRNLRDVLPPAAVREVARLVRTLRRTPSETGIRGGLHFLRNPAQGAGAVDPNAGPVAFVLYPLGAAPFRALLCFEATPLERACTLPVLDAANDTVFVLTRGGELAALNRAAERSFGGVLDAGLGRSLVGLLEPSFARAEWRQMLAVLLRRGNFCGEVRIATAGGATLSLWCTVTPVRDTQQRISHWVVVAPDLDQHAAGRSRLMQLAFYDALTELPNRRLFSEHLKTALRRAERHGAGLTVLFIDLDRVASINETLGREAGDALLREVSQRLRRELRSADVLARLGADDFGVVLEEVGIEQDATRVCHKLLAALTRPFDLLGNDVFCGANIGVALYPAAGSNDLELLHAAEIAVVYARVAGRNKYVFYSDTFVSASPPAAP